MKKLLFTVVIGAVAGLVVAQEPLMIQEQADVAVSGDVGLYSAYVWRGQIYEDFNLQPSLTVAKGPVSLNILGIYNLDGKDGRPDNDLTETDFTLAYRIPDNTDDFDIDVGIIKYTYTDASGTFDTDTEELFITAIFYNIILTPVASLYHDLDRNEGWYGSLAVSQPLEISEAMKLEAGASIGMADGGYNSTEYTGTTKSSSGGSLNDYNISLKASYVVTDDLTLGARVQYTLLDGKINDGAKDKNGSDNVLWAGISLSYTF
jgi:uncharacterized protein (TIGR02001 family)